MVNEGGSHAIIVGEAKNAQDRFCWRRDAGAVLSCHSSLRTNNKADEMRCGASAADAAANFIDRPVREQLLT